MGFGATVSRIKNDPLRGILAVFWFPFSMICWLRTVLIHDPKQLLTARPYILGFTMFLIVVDGHFAGDPLE
jgi:hypothetical protein